MRKYGKRMTALCLSLLMLMLAVVPSSASEAGTTDQETVLLTVEKNGNGEVEITGEQVVQESEDRYAVKAGTEVAVKLSEAEGFAPGIAILNEQEISDTFYMPEIDQVLSVTFANLPEEEVLNENVPEENAPGENVPEENAPGENVPEENAPEENVPEKNVPEENAPGENVPEENAPEENVPEKNVPEENAPGENVPEEKMPEEVPKLLLFSGRAASGTVTVNGSGITPDIGQYGVGVGSFTVNFNGKTYKAYCACHERKGVTVGMRLSASVTNNASIRKCLYYGNGGPQDRGYGHTPTSLAISVANGHMDSSDTGETDASIGRNTLAKINALPNPPASFLAYYAVSPDPSFQDIAFWTWGTGKAMLKKASANPEMTENNLCYSLKGARYGVFKDQACQTKAGELVTDENGDTNQLELGAGTYYVKELEAPEGYALDPAVYSVNVEAGKTAVVNVKDRPQNDPLMILLGKYDGEKTYNGEANLPQGAATLAGAEFTVKIYAGLYEQVEELEGIDPKRSWVFKTNRNGFANFAEEYLVSGDEFWFDSSGNITLPLGTVTIQETKAPEGYNLNEEIFLRQITSDGVSEGVNTYNMPQIPEKVVKGSVKIKKYGIDPDDKEQIKTPLEGIEFVFTSKTTQEVVTTIVTDENGNAIAEDLPFDTYLVTEENTPENYIPCDSFEVTIQEEGEVLSYVIDNKEIRAAITIVKKDAETGKIIPVSGTTFRILDAEKKPISMRAPYPSNQMLTEFQTDQSGTVTLPERLKYGTYYLEEVKAPEGYLKGELLEFHIDKKHDYERPLVVEYYDENVQGQIQLTKIDQETKAALAGAEFTVQAAEDIVTPDGTVRAKKGEIVDTIITDHDGKGISKKLFLGKYLVKETKAPDGYLLNEEVYQVNVEYQDQDTPIVWKNLTVTNEPAMGQITIKKTDSTTEKPLAGATFDIAAAEDIVTSDGTVRAEKGEVVDRLVTDDDGKVKSKKLFLGKYEVKEVRAPEDYLVDSRKPVSVELNYKDQLTEVVFETVEFQDTPIQGRIEVVKFDETDEDNVRPGAEFDIIAAETIISGDGTVRAKKDEIVDHLVTDENGRASSKPLFIGMYLVKETKPPQGFVLNPKSYEVELKAPESENVSEERDLSKDWNVIAYGLVEVPDKPTEIKIKKTDEAGNPLAGVVFKIWNKDTAAENVTDQKIEDVLDNMGVFTEEEQLDKGMLQVAEYKTDAKGEISVRYLSPGTYCVQEIRADGYVVDAAIHELTIDENGLVEGKEEGVLKLSNKPNELILKKLEKGSGRPLSGVSFKIWNKAMEEGVDSEMAVPSEHVTDQDGKIQLKKLVPGTYCIQETKTKNGYVLDSTIHEIVVAEDGRINGRESYELTLSNDYIKVEISKQTEEQKPLSGAHMELWEYDTNTVVEQWISEENPHRIDRLSPGNYVLREAKAPKGYEKAKEIIFEVKEIGEIQRIVMYDKESEVVKTGDTNKLGLYLGFLLGAAGMVAYIQFRRKRKQ